MFCISKLAQFFKLIYQNWNVNLEMKVNAKDKDACSLHIFNKYSQSAWQCIFQIRGLGRTRNFTMAAGVRLSYWHLTLNLISPVSNTLPIKINLFGTQQVLVYIVVDVIGKLRHAGYVLCEKRTTLAAPAVKLLLYTQWLRSVKYAPITFVNDRDNDLVLLPPKKPSKSVKHIRLVE